MATNKNMKKCVSCQKEIGGRVKKCVHCGEDQRNWFMRHKIITGFLIVLVIGFWSVIGSGDDTTESKPTNAVKTTTNEKPKEKEKEEKTYGLNETISLKGVDVTVTKIETKENVGTEGFSKEVSQGGTYVAIQYSLTNTSDEPLSSFSQPSLSLEDKKGTGYDADIEASGYYATETDANDQKILSDLNPGITVTGTKVFEISKSSYESGQWYVVVDGKEKVKIK